jgi:hypothetical protein
MLLDIGAEEVSELLRKRGFYARAKVPFLTEAFLSNNNWTHELAS